VVAALVASLLAVLPFAPQLQEGDTIPAIPLIDQDGRSFRLASLHGRAVVVSFIYTRCSDSCALTAAKLARIAHAADPRSVAVVALSVDPTFDRPARLHRYRARFETPERWTIATGEPGQVRLLERRLGVEPESKGDGRTDHADIVVLLDGAGRIARFISGDDWTPEQVATMARAAVAGEHEPVVALQLILSGVLARCGQGVAALGTGAAIALGCALAFLIGLPLVRALSH